MLIGIPFGSGSWDIDFVLRGPDLKALADYADRLRIRSKGKREATRGDAGRTGTHGSACRLE